MANKTGSSSGSDNGDSHNSSLSSASEEEQLRRLFNSCDADGDGFLDGEDLQFMCRMLNMSDSVEEVRSQLGLTEMSKISFQDFLHCRARVMLQNPGAQVTGLQPHQYRNPQHMGAGVVVTLPPPTVMMTGVGVNMPGLPFQTQYQHMHQPYSPGDAPPAPISLPSSLYPYPHQPATDHGLMQCQPACQHHHNHHHYQHPQQQQPQYASVVPLNQRYPPSPKQAVLLGGSGEDTGVESDVTGANPAAGHRLTSWPTLSSDSLGALSCPRPDSADYDSGARDLSPEPGVSQPSTLTLSQLVERHDPEAFTQLRETGADSLLGIADRLHAAALTSMKGEVQELQNQVRQLTLEYRPLTSSPPVYGGQGHNRQQVPSCDSRLGPADFEERLEQLTARYEERIIELHSVIAELRKKVERHQISVIREEDEFEESDQAQSTHSNDGGSLRDENIEISQEFSRVVSEIQPTMDRKPFSHSDLGTGLMSASYQAEIKAETDQDAVDKCNEGEEREGEESRESITPDQTHSGRGEHGRDETLPELPPRVARPTSLTRSCSSTFPSDPAVRLEVATLRAHNDELLRQTSEVTALRAHNDDLSRRGSALEAELEQMSQVMEAEQRKKEELAQQVSSLQRQLDRLQSQQANADVLVSPTHSPAKLTSTPPPNSDVRAVEGESYPVAKMAELKKLKTCASDSHVLGSEVAMMGVQNTSTAEHLVQALHQVSGVAELIKAGPGSRGGAGGNGESQGEQLNAAVVAEFEVELERRQAKCDHLKAQNDVLSATLEESRSYAERLSVLMGKYESNNTALQLASAFSDHCLEAQDVLTALLDTEMGVLLANCRAAGLGALAGVNGHDCEDQQEVTSTLHRAHHARRKAESVAAHLLARLDRGGSGHGVGGGGSAGNPWEDVSTNSRTASTSSTSSSTEAQHSEFTKEDEGRLREHIQQLKAERSAVRTTVLEIESVHMDPVVNEPRRRLEAQRLDLENAVLVQELMAVKEEKAELKAGSYLLEKETKALELRLVGHEAQESALRLQVDHLQGELQYLQQQQDDTVPTTPRSPSKQGLSSSPSLGVMAKKSKISGNSPSSTLSSSSSSSDLVTTKSPADLARDLAVAKAREATLKGRVSELLSALEKISRNSEMRHRQSSEFVGDLKRANAALISAFDRAKRKYQSRLKKMEGQLRVMREGGGGGGESSGGGSSRASEGRTRNGGVVVMRQPPPPPDETSL